ncbi:MAG: hypothetical protein DRP50_03825 [Thermotoga sp.]|nr:MAG: hypothetical protein DRP50_03825 [Thermotoga sp.]
MDLNEKIDRLKKEGITLTIQRYAVLEYLYKNRTHPTAEDIYHDLKKRFPTISQATIYNTLNLLENYGLIQEITAERGRSHFDYNAKPHHHFICRKCGRIYDVDVKGCPLVGKKTIDGHKIEELRVYIIGICSECLEKEGREKNEK